jgi:hypothetical protein
MEQSIPWYRVELASARLAINRQQAIRARFEQFFPMTREPPAMAMFGSVLIGGVQCLYFSPATAASADEYLRLAHAWPCAGPAERIKLAVGREDSLGRFRTSEL